MRNELIDKIQEIREELKPLRVRDETFDLEGLSLEALQAEFEAKSEQLARRKKFLSDNSGKFADYFLRYSATVPPDEVAVHRKFSRDCPCEPTVTFDEKNDWHDLIHKPLEISKENYDK